MKSITIKDPMTGEKLIKVYRKDGYTYVDKLSTVADIDVLIVFNDKSRMTIPVRKK